MRLIFMGTPQFAVPSLEALLQAGHRIDAVVTQPDRPRGRGQMLAASPVKDTAIRNAIPVLQPVKVREPEFVEHLRSLAPDAIIVVAFGQLLPASILSIPPFGCINVHASLLPRWRGAAPIQHAIMHGDKTTGVTTMLMDPGMDTGPILLQTSTPVHPMDTSGTLATRLAEMGAALLLETLVGLQAGTITPIPQEEAGVTMAPSLSREDGCIDWTRSGIEIHNLVRAFNPHPGAFTFRHGELLKVWMTELLETGEPSVSPGTVLAIGDSSLVIQAGRDSVRLLQVQPEARKRMTGEDYARGYRVQPGEAIG